jgi:hypothetical protein
VKPNINSVEVHPELSNNRHPVGWWAGGCWCTVAQAHKASFYVMKVVLLKKNCERNLRYIVSWKNWKTMYHVLKRVQQWDDRCVPVLVRQVSMSRRKQGLNWRFPPNSFALHHKKQQIQVPKRDWIAQYHPKITLLYTRKNNKFKFQPPEKRQNQDFPLTFIKTPIAPFVNTCEK